MITIICFSNSTRKYDRWSKY